MSSYSSVSRDKSNLIRSLIDSITWKRKGENRIKTITGSYTLTPEDKGQVLYIATGSATITIPTSFDLGTGAQIDLISIGGTCTITRSANLVSSVASNSFQISPQYGVCTLIQISGTTWLGTGNLIP